MFQNSPSVDDVKRLRREVIDADIMRQHTHALSLKRRQQPRVDIGRNHKGWISGLLRKPSSDGARPSADFEATPASAGPGPRMAAMLNSSTEDPSSPSRSWPNHSFVSTYSWGVCEWARRADLRSEGPAATTRRALLPYFGLPTRTADLRSLQDDRYAGG